MSLFAEVTENEVAEGEAENCRQEETSVEGHHHKHKGIGQKGREEVGGRYHEFVKQGQVEVVTKVLRFKG